MHDSDGRIFLDFDPYCFQEIVSYLRQRAIDTEPVPYPAVQPNKQHMFNKLVQYLCLEEYMGKPQEPCQIKFTANHPEISLQLEGYHAVSTAVQPGYRCAVIGSPMLSSTSLILDCGVTCTGWVFIGIVQHDDACTALLGPNSAFALHHASRNEQRNAQEPFLGPVFAAVSGGMAHHVWLQHHWGRQHDIFGPHTVGWSSAKEEIKNGQCCFDHRLPEWSSGDRVWLEVDSVNSYVYMRHLSKPSTEHSRDVKRTAGFPIPKEFTKYSVQVVLQSSGDAVNLMPPPQIPCYVTADDVDWVSI